MYNEIIISEWLKDLGVSPGLKGYNYLRCAIDLCIDRPELDQAITKELYPLVAEICNTTPTRVERCMRHAIQHSWNIGNIETRHKLFSFTIAYGHKPTNAEFITTIADHLRMNPKSSPWKGDMICL